MSDSTFLTRVALENYKSIKHCDVQLRPLMFLVGPNGAGKSNFLDALRFVSDALTHSLGYAIRQRGDFYEVCHRSQKPANYMRFRFDFQLPSGSTGYYTFEVGQGKRYHDDVRFEECRVRPNGLETEETYFRVENSQVTMSESIVPAATSGQLYLMMASGFPAFLPVYQALSRMAFYNLNPEKIRDYQTPQRGELLTRDGDNITSVLESIKYRSPDVKQRIEEYLAVIVPGMAGVDIEDYKSKEAVVFFQHRHDIEGQTEYSAASMSDGTLRALGILVALFQTADSNDSGVSLVGIEEPETALHPAAVAVLLDALEEGSLTRQVLVTTHSADLLDNRRVDPNTLLAVASHQGATEIGPIDEVSRSILRDHLYTAGEMLRMSQFAPDTDALQQIETEQTQKYSENAA